MKSKEERAEEWAKSVSPWAPTYNEARMRDYVIGATEQEKITIDKACEWLKNNEYLATNGWYTIKGTLEDFRKYMEE